MKNLKKWLIVSCALMILAVSMVETIAYLKHDTGPVNNTFAMGKLLEDSANFVLKEHLAVDEDEEGCLDGVYELDNSNEVDTNEYTVLPGVDLPKDPFIKTTEPLQLDAYVFVEVVEKDLGTALHYAVDTDNWILLDGTKGPQNGAVYVMKAGGGIAPSGSALAPVYILAKDAESGMEITVDNAEITDAEAQLGGDLEFYGYMIQAGGFKDYSEAWNGIVEESN